MNPTQAGAAALVLAVPYAAGAPLLPTGAGAVAADVHVPVLCIRASDEETAPPRPARGDSLFFGRVRDETCPISTEGWTRRVHFVREGGGGAPHLATTPSR